ncbi:MAG TPA: zinc-binding dehydrogenase [Vicinamibacterales bacterium]|nr:zinc-binding dehydrogenase [Vicinamibacterales bacterium]
MPTVIAAVMPAPRARIDIREFQEPDLPVGGALLRTAFSEVCGTDVHLWHGRLSGVPYPIIPGHVTTGTLDKVRGGLRDVTGAELLEGDRIAFFDVHRTCGRCLACTVHRTPTRCSSRRVYGITDSAAEGLFGGWSQKVYLEPGVIVAKLPDAVTFEAYIGGGCGLLTAVHIIERSRITMGDTVVVQGAGAVGMSAAALARKAGAGQVIVIGAPADRLALAADMGADHAIDIDHVSPDERLQRVLELTAGLGADVVIEAAGSPRAFEEGLRMARNGGAYVIAGHYTNTGDSTINAHEHINRKHLEIRGCWGSEAGHFLRALRALERYGHEVPWARIGAATYGLGQLNEALETAEALRIPKALVDPWR